MSETEVLAVSGMEDVATSSAERAGQLLRQAREAAGVHIETLAVMLKVQAHTVEALEEGRLNELLDLVFARGLASSICRALKVDPEPVLALLPRKEAPRLGMGTSMMGHQPSFRSHGRPAGPTLTQRLMSSPAGLMVLLLVVGALVLLLLPRLQVGDDQEVGATTSEPVAATGALEITPAQAPGAGAFVTEATVVVPALQPVPATLTPASVAQAATPAAAAASAASNPAGVAAPTAASVNADVLTISAKASSWVRVTDATGAVSLNRTLQSGETVQAGGAEPLAVVVGAANAVQVQVRGQPFDLGPVTRSNVARFEVK